MKKILFLLMMPILCFGQNLMLFDSLIVSDEGIFTYNQKPFNGTAFANSTSGILLYEKDFENGKEIKNRNYYAFITDSIPHLKFETQVKDGKRNGLRRGWYHSGELKFEGYFKNGWNNGSYKNWYENGNLEKESFFEMGVKVGSHKNWSNNGKLIKERFYQKLSRTSSKLVKRVKYLETGEIISKECWDIEGSNISCD